MLSTRIIAAAIVCIATTLPASLIAAAPSVPLLPDSTASTLPDSSATSSERLARLGLYAGIVGDVHVNALLMTTPRHGIATIDAGGVGYRAGVLTAFALGETWDILPNLGFASWSASGRRDHVLSSARVVPFGRDPVDTLVPVDILAELDYRMVEIGMLFENLLRRIDSRTVLTAGIGPAVSIIVESNQREGFEVEGDEFAFASTPGSVIEANGARIFYWDDEINRRAFVRMSGTAAISISRDVNERAVVRGTLAFNIPLTSVVELSSWRAFAACATIAVYWKLDAAPLAPIVSP